MLQAMEPGRPRKIPDIGLQVLLGGAWWGLYIFVFILFLSCFHLVFTCTIHVLYTTDSLVNICRVTRLGWLMFRR